MLEFKTVSHWVFITSRFEICLFVKLYIALFCSHMVIMFVLVIDLKLMQVKIERFWWSAALNCNFSEKYTVMLLQFFMQIWKESKNASFFFKLDFSSFFKFWLFKYILNILKRYAH